MSGVIYLDNGSGQLEAMTESPYDSEDILQGLLEDHSDLLAGEQMNSVAPRRWLLLAREAALPDTEGGTGRWSVDHLFVDQDGVPTIVEVKRSSDTRIRREVVGQTLDYAANAVVYWPVEQLRARYEAACSQRGLETDTELLERLGVDSDVESFWQLVKTNLQAGRVRMVFVGDVIPNELRRVIEFLNVQMNPAEVLAVEIKQYVGNARRALVPRVVGQTQQAAAQKGSGGSTPSPRDWNEESLLDAIMSVRSSESASSAHRILRWCEQHNLHPRWGHGATLGSCSLELVTANSVVHPLSLWTDGNVYIEFRKLSRTPPFTDEALRLQLMEQLNVVPGARLSPEKLDRSMSISLRALESEDNLAHFLSTIEWVIAEVNGATPA